MKPCPECNSTKVYQFKKYIDAEGGYGPALLPKLAKGMFATPKFLPVVCAECGYTRFFASKEARNYLEDSEHWLPV